MEKSEIIAGNETIAKFMGTTRHDLPKGYGDGYYYRVVEGQVHEPEHLRYHEDWNWLMPCIKKVNNTHIFSDKIIIYKPALMNALMENDIKEAWNIVTQFIKLCNEYPYQHGT